MMETEDKIKAWIEDILEDRQRTTGRPKLASRKLLDCQKQALREYYDAIRLGKRTNFLDKQRHKSSKAKSYGSYYSYLQVLSYFAKFVNKPFDEVNEKDIDGYRAYLKNEGLSHNTFQFRSLVIKMFFLWFLKCKIIPPMIEYTIEMPKRKVIKAEEVLLPSEIKTMIGGCDKSRDKALISVLFEGTCRVGEICTLKIKSVLIDDYGAKISVKGKTGERNIRLIDSVGYLQNWLNEHPQKTNPEAYVFVSMSDNHYGKNMNTTGITSILKTIAKRTGIKKRVNPHWFRHSGLDWLAQHNFNERDLKIRAGWTMNSNMHLTYLHYGEDEVDAKYCQMKGKEKPSRTSFIEEEQLKPIICPRCQKENTSDSRYCNCGQVLDKKEAIKLEQLRTQANDFTGKLLQTPVDKEADMSKGIMEALYQTMKKNPIMLEEFRRIVSSTSEAKNGN